jgi:phosphate:Na+ symporter
VEVISRQIANGHTLFNGASTLLWLPMVAVMERIVTWLVPDSPPADARLSPPVKERKV